MHVLMTADTIGGVWTYTRELVTQLCRLGLRITLVSFGEIPSAEQSKWVDDLPAVSYYPTAFRLEWMQDAQSDLEQSAEFLKSLVAETKPDLLHFNQFYYGTIDCGQPRVVVAHSDVVSWWIAVHGVEPPANDWIRHYRENVIRGLNRADLVVAPTRWMLDQVSLHYGEPAKAAVVYNGRDPRLFDSDITKQNYILSIGRLWDAGKQAMLLLRDDLPWQTILVGSEQSPEGAIASAQSMGRLAKLRAIGQQSEKQLRQLLAGASMYLATSRYEPFGLAPLEAAFSGCPIVANDLSSFREIWGEDAIYFELNNSGSLLLTIQELASNPLRRSEYGNRALQRARSQFSSEKMAQNYLTHYRSLIHSEVAAA
jgi:glycogen synthase